MDTSETYIKMCQEAKEIQTEHILSEGDFYSPDGREMGIWCYEYQEVGIWLPRQDQLQEMIWQNRSGICYQKPLSLLAYLFHFAYDTYQTQRPEIQELLNNKDASMEQLWFAFAMKEKYNKSWTGKNWLLSKKGVKEDT